jgi:hypothetical protein
LSSIAAAAGQGIGQGREDREELVESGHGTMSISAGGVTTATPPAAPTAVRSSGIMCSITSVSHLGAPAWVQGGGPDSSRLL